MTHLKETSRIAIGNSSFPFRPLTLGQIEAIMPVNFHAKVSRVFH